MFEDGITNSLSDDKSSNNLIENSRTKVVSKRSLSDDSDKQKVELSQNKSDEGWWSRAKRSFKSLFWKNEEKVVEKREAIPEANKSQENLADFTPELSSQRRRRQYDDEEDDDEDNEIGSGVDPPETTPVQDLVTPLPPVKDDKYCKRIHFSLENCF
jgi:hypothetical protein